MLSNILKAVGFVFILLISILMTMISLYISYVLAIGLLILTGIFVVYHFLAGLSAKN